MTQSYCTLVVKNLSKCYQIVKLPLVNIKKLTLIFTNEFELHKLKRIIETLKKIRVIRVVL